MSEPPDDGLTRMSVADARREFAQLLSRVGFGSERIVVMRHGKPLAALVCMEDLQYLERADDQLDEALAREIAAGPASDDEAVESPDFCVPPDEDPVEGRHGALAREVRDLREALATHVTETAAAIASLLAGDAPRGVAPARKKSPGTARKRLAK